MKKWLRFLLPGLVAYGVFLIATFPAAHAYRLVEGKLEGLRLSGIDGSVWSGSADAIQTSWVRLENLRWDAQFLPLLLGRLEVELSIADSDLQLNTHAGRSIGGAVYIKDLQGQAPIARVQAMTPYPVPALQGQLLFDELEITLSDGDLLNVSGNLDWSDAVATIGSPLELGGFSVELKTEAQEIIGRLQDTGGPLQAEGLLKLAPEGTYQFDAEFTPRDSNGKVAQNLRMLGAPNQAGGYEINYSGRLPVPAL